MRTPAALLFAFACTACARQRVATIPSPASASSRESPRVVLAGAASSAAPLGRAAIGAAEAVDYLLSRDMAIPVAGTSVKQLQDTFDEGRDGGRVHRALDILAPRGTPVIAADSGRILRVRYNALGGNTIYAVDPLGRLVYYYAHLDAYRRGLAEGAVVARGDTLGFVGTTGNAPKDTPHLHFQVMRMPPDGKYWDGEAINPYPLFLLTHAAARHDTLVEGAR
jgi:murein DD-endopeptidase MepM/ murein hydrolase activator NlpD